MFAWIPFTTAFNAKMQRKAAAQRQEQERLDRERIERNNRIKSMSEQARFPQPARARTLYESSPARVMTAAQAHPAMTADRPAATIPALHPAIPAAIRRGTDARNHRN